jgi:hypothetical protein
MMDISNRPKTVYKYRNTFDKNHLRLLSHNEIYFASPAQMNDPFDCGIPFTCWDAPDDKIREFFKLTSLSGSDEVFASLMKVTVEEFIDWKISVKPKTREEQIVEEIDVMKLNTEMEGIFCVVSDNEATGSLGYNNNLMWSHYSIGHSGFCVGINTPRLIALDEQPHFLPVKYTDVYPHITPYKADGSVQLLSNDDIDTILTTKDISWRYENEWRLFRRSLIIGMSGRGSYVLPDDAIESVYLGLNISEVNVGLIVDILTKRAYKPQLFRAVRKPLSFGLNFVEVNY